MRAAVAVAPNSATMMTPAPESAQAQLAAIGYRIAVYPLTLLNVSILAMREALETLRHGATPSRLLNFEQLTSCVGFPEYCAEEARYRLPER